MEALVIYHYPKGKMTMMMKMVVMIKVVTMEMDLEAAEEEQLIRRFLVSHGRADRTVGISQLLAHQEGGSERADIEGIGYSRTGSLDRT